MDFNVRLLKQGWMERGSAPRGGKPPVFGKDPNKGLFAGDGARAPFGCPQE